MFFCAYGCDIDSSCIKLSVKIEANNSDYYFYVYSFVYSENKVFFSSKITELVYYYYSYYFY